MILLLTKFIFLMKKITRIFNILFFKKNLMFSSRQDLNFYQQQKIKQHLYFLKKESQYFKFINFDNLEDLPIMNKSIMMSNFDLLNTAGIKKDDAIKVAIEAEKTRDFKPQINNITIGLSSGTSGNKGIFLVSKEDENKYIEVVYNKVLKPLKFRKTRVALFFRANSNLYQSINSLFINIKYFDLTLDIDSHIRYLEKFNPHIIVAPPSLLSILAERKNSNQISITPEKIISVADILEDDVKLKLSKNFNITIHQLYQCTEGFLGSTCKYGNLHLHEEYIYFEKRWIDKKNKRFVPIITDFTRKTQPIIRYELNDILQEGEQCKCGNIATVINKIEGRSDDIFIFNNSNDKKTLVYPDEIRNTIIISSNLVENYLVKQINDKTLILSIKIKDKEELNIEFMKIKDGLNILFIKKGVENIKILQNEFKEPDLSTKNRRIINETRY